ncbi:MAG TPA: hypothetical protein VGD43_18420 [Micromonospora sp.]
MPTPSGHPDPGGRMPGTGRRRPAAHPTPTGSGADRAEAHHLMELTPP